MEIMIETRVSSQSHLASLLGRCLPDEIAILHHSGAGVRGLDSSVMVAALASGGTAFGALITGLLSVLTEAFAKKIIIVGKSGWRVEVPFDIAPSDLTKLINDVKELDVTQVVLDK